MSILSFLSDKGGSGKTTTTMNVGAALVREGKKVLMIDMDPQANLTQGLGMKAEAEKSSVVDLFNKLLSNEKIGKGEATCQHEEGMYLIPSNNDLYGFEASLYNAMMRETVLHRLIESIKGDYDFILLDSPPQQNLLMLNILAAVDSIIVPVQTQEYSVSNLSEFFKLVGNVKGSGLNPRLTVDGLIPSMFNKQTKDSQAHLAAIHKDYSKEYFVFLNPIPYTVRLQETSSKQKSIFKIEPGGRAAEVIKMIGKEVMRFERERNEKNNLYEQPIRRGKKLPKGRAKNRSDTETLTSIGQRHMCQFSVLRNQMEAGMNTCLPYGLRFVSNLRTVSTENASTLIPFVCTDLWQPGGMCIGTNPMSKSVVILNTLLAPSQNFWVLGMTGAGKSMFLKWQILNIFLSRPEDDIIWLDPEREGGPVMKLLNDNGYGNQCEFIHLSAGSSQHINAFDPMKFVQDGDDPISIKCDFVLTFFETAIGSSNMGAIQQSIVDRCTRRLLMNAQKDGITITLEDLYLLLLEQEEPEARDLATAMELYVMGSLNCFSQPTNVNMDSRLLCFDIRDLHAGKTKSLGMLITIDAIQNRISYNRSRGKRTWLFCDEAWILMAEPVTARFFDSFWRRLRKYGGAGEALSQNVTSLLNTDYGRDMLGNSEHIVMFNQSQKDRAALQDILGLSDMQLNFINNAESGTGLLRTSNVVVPFDGRFSKDTAIYRAFTTKIEEVAQ